MAGNGKNQRREDKTRDKMKGKSLPEATGATNWLTLKKTLEKAKKDNQSQDKPLRPNKIRKLEECRQRRKDTHKSMTQKGKVERVWFNDMTIQFVNGEMVARQQKRTPAEMAVKQKEDTIDTSHTHHIALDCEMVMGGVKGAYYSMLGRCSIVNCHGNTIYDTYVQPLDKVAFYNTRYSGIKPCHLKDAPDFKTVQKEVASILNGKVLIGHALQNDLKVLFISHPKHMIRDTSQYPPFKALSKGGTHNSPSLKALAMDVLGLDIQNGAHDSVEDASVTMQLYQLHKKDWERSLLHKHKKPMASRKPLSTSEGKGAQVPNVDLAKTIHNKDSSISTAANDNCNAKNGISSLYEEKDTCSSLTGALKRSIASMADKTDRTPLFSAKCFHVDSGETLASKKKKKKARRKELRKEALLKKRLKKECFATTSTEPFHIMLNSDL